MKTKKNYSFLLYTLLCLFIVHFSYAQFDLGLKFGYSADNSVNEINYLRDKSGFIDNSITLQSTSNTKYVGIFTHAKFGYLFLESDFMYNQYDYYYTWANFLGGGNPYDNYSESYKFIDVSAFSGLNIGIARVGMGPVAHFLMNYDSDLKSMDFYEYDFRPVTFGWRFGTGVSYGRFHADIKYEINFHTNGYHMEFFGENQHFEKSPSKFIFSVGIAI
jgi:hypothetical protein